MVERGGIGSVGAFGLSKDRLEGGVPAIGYGLVRGLSSLERKLFVGLHWRRRRVCKALSVNEEDSGDPFLLRS